MLIFLVLDWRIDNSRLEVAVVLFQLMFSVENIRIRSPRREDELLQNGRKLDVVQRTPLGHAGSHGDTIVFSNYILKLALVTGLRVLGQVRQQQQCLWGMILFAYHAAARQNAVVVEPPFADLSIEHE